MPSAERGKSNFVCAKTVLDFSKSVRAEVGGDKTDLVSFKRSNWPFDENRGESFDSSEVEEETNISCD